jgi:hypothetical protein
MVLLLLGLALVLATSSSLLATSGSGRGDNGGNPPNPPNPQPKSNDFPEPGEISGSVSLTSEGELMLTTFVDHYSFLSEIEVIENTQGELEYKFTIIAIAEAIDMADKKIDDIDGETHILEVKFSSPEEASERLVSLVKNLGIDLTEESVRSVPFAVMNGWRSPEYCQDFVQSLMDKHSKE